MRAWEIFHPRKIREARSGAIFCAFPDAARDASRHSGKAQKSYRQLRCKTPLCFSFFFL
jgi:hypothetical protein